MNLPSATLVLDALRLGPAGNTRVARAIAVMEEELALLDASVQHRDPSHFVIRYQDGAYNLNSGFATTVTEATLYPDEVSASSAAAELCDVERVLTYGEALELEAVASA